MRVSQILPFIQGEGVHSGVPMLLIRTVSCPGKCIWCDSVFSKTGGYEISVDELIDRIQEQKLQWVCLSGGEPLVWEKEIGELIQHPRWTINHLTEIETSGFMPVPEWWYKVSNWVVDWKCPSSGEESREIRQWIKALRSRWYRAYDAIKFVVSDENDLKFVKRHAPKGVIVIVSPAISKISKVGSIVTVDTQWIEKVWNFCIENNLRFSMQSHKFVFGSERIDV